MNGARPLRLVALVGAAIVTAASLTSCKAPESADGGAVTDVTTASESEVTPGGELAFGLDAETNGWDPTESTWSESGYQVAKAIFDPLAVFDADQNVQPYLAESFESNDDYSAWTIHLREGIQFHDGSPFEAEAVKQNLDASRASIVLSGLLRPIEDVRVVDPRTVQVVMSTPWSTFPGYLTAQPGFMAAPSQLADPQGALNPVGTGPFVFDEWAPEAHLSASKYHDYWRDGFPLLDQVDFVILADDATRLKSLETGEIDMMQSNQAEQLVDLRDRAEDGEFQLVIDDRAETSEIVIGLNTGEPPFDDPIAREAVATGIDTQAISDTVFLGVFEPARGPLKSDSPNYSGTDYPSFDPARAKDLAEQYEQEHGEPLSFKITTPPDPAILEIVQVAQQHLEAASIEMSVNSPDQSQLLIDALVGNYDAVGFITFSTPTVEGEYLFLHSSNALPVGEIALAFTRMKNPELDDALDGLRALDLSAGADEKGQKELVATIQDELASDLAWVFLVHMTSGVVAQPEVRDLTTWTLPDGSTGLAQQGAVVSLYQIWKEQ